jgi:predicted ATPase
LFHLGELAAGRRHLEQGIALCRQQHLSLASHGRSDPGMACRYYAAWALWLLGYPDRALQRSHKFIGLAQELSDPHSLAFALLMAAILHTFRREVQAARERTEALIALSSAHAFPLRLAQGRFLQGWVLAEQRQETEGITEMHQSLAARRATGAGIPPTSLASLAEVYRKAGQAQEGLGVLDEALAVAHTTGERWWEAELHRLNGELLLALSLENRTKAEACFCQALDVARRQQAKSLELRAAASLSRLWRQQGKREEARQLLAEIYGWFTEGFDTADLHEAKALLEELS